MPPLYKQKSLEKNQLGPRGLAISMGGSPQYKIIWWNEGSVGNWQTIPSHLFVQPLSIEDFKSFITRFHWAVGFFITHEHNLLLAWCKSDHHYDLDHYRVIIWQDQLPRNLINFPLANELLKLLILVGHIRMVWNKLQVTIGEIFISVFWRHRGNTVALIRAFDSFLFFPCDWRVQLLKVTKLTAIWC